MNISTLDKFRSGPSTVSAPRWRGRFHLDRRLKAFFGSRADLRDEENAKDLWDLNQRSFFCPDAGPHATVPRFAGRSITSARHLSRTDIELVLHHADLLRARIEAGERLTILEGRILATLFYEPSTRTRLSFEAAMHRMGGAVISTADGGSSSSAVKGETIADTIRTVAGYADVIVQRHPAVGSADEAACAAQEACIPVINAGDGAGEHPTQALLDICTMLRERQVKTLTGLRIVLAGDLKHGRTVHSLLHALALWPGVQITLAAPRGLEMPASVLDQHPDLAPQSSDNLAEAAAGADILYMTRIQKERFTDPAAYEAIRGCFRVDGRFMCQNPGLTLLHPLPRVDEIAPEVDSNPSAAYFRQAHNGLYVRMALLGLVTGALR